MSARPSSPTTAAPAPKRSKACTPLDLKSFNTNVTVIVGKGEDKSEHQYLAYELASMSPWMEEQLLDIEEDDTSFEIYLEDISTEYWLAMIKFASSVVEARKMTKEDAMLVVPGYHKYGFTEGLALCDQVLSDYMKSPDYQDKNSTLDVEFMSSAIAAAHKYHLTQANRVGCAYIMSVFIRETNLSPIDLSLSAVEKLAPVFECLAKRDPGFTDAVMPRFTVSKKCKTLDCIKNPMFPEIFCAEWRRSKAVTDARESKRIKINEAFWDGDRELFDARSLFWKSYFSSYTAPNTLVDIDGAEYKVAVSYEASKGWGISALRRWSPSILLWEVVDVGGKYSTLPPEDGWRPVHPLASGNPTIEYISNRDVN